ncbi:MAG: KH domain-containing protein [Lachnospiraceae bacterium]|nr:KH domain-containing protein [Lachnospiraceae bacterium]
MKELVRVIAEALVDQTDKIQIQEEQADDTTVIKLCVAPDETSKVIGKKGRIAKSIRTLVRAASAEDVMKYSVEIVDEL